ncbi:MAG: right-handed parallel beta-helix repeat-containing protein, partial [Bacteroidota bacterium]
ANVLMVNNILVNMGTDPVFRLGRDTSPISTITMSNSNALYSGGPTLIEENGVSYATLADWQNATGFDLESIVKLPTFVSSAHPVNLRLAGASVDDPDLLGQEVGFVVDDIDGDERSTYHPRMGADEGISVHPLDNADASSGFYTIGGASPDFATPDEAFARLLAFGMKGPVTFRIRAGTYTVRESFPNTLRFGPAEDDPSTAVFAIRGANPSNPPVLVSNAATGTNWVFRFRGLDHVELEDLVFDVSGAGDLGRAIVIKEGEDGRGTDDLTILTSTLIGASSGVASEDRALLWSDNDGHDRLTLTGNTFTNGWAGVYLPGNADSDSPDATISDNAFKDQHAYGVHGSLGGVILSGNIFTSDASDVRAIRLGAAEGYRVLSNQIALTDALGVGLALVGTDADADGIATIANNMIRADQGIVLSQGAVGARLLHNSIYATGTTATPVSVSGAASRIAEITNTILRSLAGPALSLGQSDQLEASDGNVLVTLAHSALVEVGASSHAALAAWQAASGHDARSESFVPGFVNLSAGDLHLTGPFDGDTRLLGLPGTGILADLDGDLRSIVAPYIGADEGTPFPLGIELTLNAVLQGAYDATEGSMRTDLAATGALPLVQPYASAALNGTPLDYDGTESVSSVPPNAVDWVLLELRETASGPAVARGAFLIDASGAVRLPGGATTLSFSTLLQGTYHVVLRHRNHLAMMSTAQAFSEAPVAVDLRVASSLHGGTAAGVEVDAGVFALGAADGSFDGLVTAPDFNAYSAASASGATGYRVEDYTMDGLVTAPDFNLYNANAAAGAASTVPDS